MVADADGHAVVHGVNGPHTVTVTAHGYRPEMWVAANGANMTFDLQKPVPVSAGQATLTVTVSHITDIPIAAGHARAVVGSYLNTDDIGDPDNSITTADATKRCISTAASPDCSFSLNVRAGTIGVLANVYDIDTTQNPNVITLVRYAFKNGIVVAPNQAATTVDLALIAADDMATETVDFATPPSSLTSHVGIVGIETADGVYQTGLVSDTTSLTVQVPKLTAVGATGYRLTAVAGNMATPPVQSVVLRRAQTATTLSAGTWIDAPTNANVTRTHASFTPVAAATVHSVELKQGTADTDPSVLDITLFDPTIGDVDIPDSLGLPSGALDVKVNAVGAPGLDVTDFSLDADKDKLVEVATAPGQVAN